MNEISDQEMESWRSLRDRLLRFVLSRGIGADQAEDIVHNVLLKAMQPGGGPSDPSRLIQWLYQVTRNAMADSWRQSRPMEPVPEDLAAPPPPEQDAAPEDLLTCLDVFLPQLAPDERTALMQADREDVPQAEVARQLGLSLSGAKSKIQRARTKVRDMYIRCCAIELDRNGYLINYVQRDCGCAGGSPVKSA